MILHFKYKKSETFYFAIYAEMNTEGSGTFEIDIDDLARITYEDMFENKFGGYDEAGFKAFYETLGNMEGAKVNDMMPGAHGEYGTCVSNPIPVNGIVNSYGYLDRLRLPNGEKVEYERIGSFSSDITDQIVDGYVLKKKDGTELTTIYICPYVNATPQKAPKGFVLA